MLNLCRYIYLNPVEAKIVLHPDYYSWSSHHFYLSQTAPEWMEINLMLTIIQNKTGDFYSEFINKPVNCEKWKPGLFLAKNGDLVIDPDVVRNLHPFLNSDECTQKKKLLTQDVIANIVCENLNIDYARLLGGSRNRKISHKRIVLVYFWREYSNMCIADIAKQLSRTQSTLQRQFDHLEQDDNYFSSDLMSKIQIVLDSTLARLH